MDLDIKDQPRMGFYRLFELTLTGIRYRLFRSIMTMMVITVAIAFLINIITGSLIEDAVETEVSNRITETRTALTWVARISQPADAEEILLEIGSYPFESPQVQEAAGFGNLDPVALGNFYSQAKLAKLYLKFFDNLAFDKKKALVGKEIGLEIFNRLQIPANWEQFQTRRAKMISIRFPKEFSSFQDFVSRWPDTFQTLKGIREKRNQAVTLIRETSSNGNILNDLRQVDGSFGTLIRNTGFLLTKETAAKIKLQAENVALTLRLQDSLGQTAMKKAVAGKLNLAIEEINPAVLWKFLSKKTNAQWYLETYRAQTGITLSSEASKLQEIAHLKQEERTLIQMQRQLVKAEGGLFGLGLRLTWLLFVSLLVCAVGIANAMLMSVTERYTEIATLKCLGALDRSILWIFVLEAALLGTVGGIAGTFLGVFLGTGRMFFGFGSLVLSATHWPHILIAMLITITLGSVLAALASVFPSLKAARLAPMEAMRIE